MRKYILGIILALLLGLGGIFNANTMALDSDYKNNLLKVDINKAQDGSYNIELFTQKPYNEPVKVIKKSDTSYYVLLPETYHSITSVPSNGDVSKVDVKLFPYAGQDLNNGYTKINISTNKPVTFNTNVKTASAQKPQVDSKKLAQLDKAFDNKTNVPTKVASVPNQIQKPVIGVKPVDTTKTDEPKKVEKPSSTPAKIAANTEKPVVKPKTEPAAGTEIEIVTKPKEGQIPKQQEILTTVKEEAIPSVSLEEVLEGDLPDEDELAMEEDAKEQGLTEIATGEDEPIPEFSYKREIKDKIRFFIKACADNPLLVIAIILFLIAIFLLLSKGKKSDKTEKEAAKASPASGSAYNSLDSLKVQDAAPQHIVEDNSVNIGKEEYSVYESGHIETPDAARVVEASAPVSVADSYEPKPMQTFEDTVVAVAEDEAQNNDEADVLATESFGENRGLCLVNYDGNIALIGYIEDEIFVIQNFGKVTLINPGIQIRVAEQNDNDTIYIVKTANSKLMVRETKTFIGLEMVM